MFVQFKCIQSDSEIFIKRRMALESSCAVVFATLVLLAVSYSGQKMGIENEKLWDIETTRLQDYTLQLTITT